VENIFKPRARLFCASSRLQAHLKEIAVQDDARLQNVSI
jgi:hypothetical protein